MKPDTQPGLTRGLLSALTVYGVVAAASLLFSAKAIFAKLAYKEGADALTVLALRMGFSLPVFAIVLWQTNRRAEVKLTGRDWRMLILLGFIGYYLSSLADFTGLEHISAGLERIVLYTYPALVVLGTALWRKRMPRAAMIAAAAAAWGGIALAFAGEAQSRTGESHDLWIGTGLVLFSACTYAAFVIISGDMVKRVGGFRFMAAVCTVSGVMMLMHWACVRPLGSLTALSEGVWTQGVLLAVLGTLFPAFLSGIGLRLAGAQRFAIIGSIGPVGTLLLAWQFLGETIDGWRIGGFALTLAGGLAASLMKEPTAPQPAPPERG